MSTEMSTEIELKLTLDPKAAPGLAGLPLLRKLATARPVSRTLKSIYFDTSSADLLRLHRTLRLRRTGQGWLQTLKEDGPLEGALQERVETEHPVARGRLDLGRIEDARLRRKLGTWLAVGELAPRFETLVRRTTWQLDTPNGATVECALDRGRLRTSDGRRNASLCEVELELKSGSTLALFALARELALAVPMSLQVRSKAERGYMLWRRDSATKPGKAHPLLLPAHATAAEAMAQIVGSGFAHLQRNWQSAQGASRYDPEHVHQMRVASRRLRTAFSVFGEIDAGLKGHALVEELRWLADLLGEARDWDVLLLETFPQLLAVFPDEPGFSALVGAARRHRRRARLAASEALRSNRYFTLTLNLCEFSVRVREHPALCVPVVPMAASLLARRHKQLRQRARRLTELTATQRHALRIAAKKLRYTAEFFGSLFAGGKLDRYLRRFGELQKGLGVLNDLATTRELMSTLAASRGTQTRHALGLCTGWAAGLEEGTLRDLPRWWKDVERAARFWPDPHASRAQVKTGESNPDDRPVPAAEMRARPARR